MLRRTTVIGLAAAALLCAAAPASASSTQLSIFEDEPVLLTTNAGQRDQALDTLTDLGVDDVRSLVYWNRIAPGGKKKPKGFDARDPGDYPAVNWDALDDFVRDTTARGMQVLLSPTAPMPLWASGCKKQNSVCQPDPTAYGQFVQALGRRYSGGYADENEGGGLLPRVSLWSLWNEPNQRGWLAPQYTQSGKKLIASAAIQYRKLAAAGIKALNASHHPRPEILLGETAPIGSDPKLCTTDRTLSKGEVATCLDKTNSQPVAFLHNLFCLDANGHKLRGAAAKLQGCSKRTKLTVGGFAHHPYTKGGSKPPDAKPGTGEITVSSISRLTQILDRAAHAGAIPSKLGVWYTEFGIQSNPPDRILGVPLDEHATDLNQADWIAYGNSRIKSVAQYKLIDENNPASFQTGLEFTNGSPKPAFDAYRLPIWVVDKGAQVQIYGQLRPAADGAQEQVEIQASTGGGAFTTVETIGVTSQKGTFVAREPAGPTAWRLRWTPSTGGPMLISRAAEVEKK